MENLTIKVEKRVPGKKNVKETRAKGFMPVEVYGAAIEKNFTGAVIRKDIIKALRTPMGRNILLNLDIEGKIVKALPYDVQIDPVKNSVSHIDFYAVKDDQEMTVSVPVLKVGRSLAEVVGGRVLVVMKEVKVKCLPANIPESITIDVTPFEIGHRIMISGLELPEGVKAVYRRDTPVLVVNKGRGEEEEKTEDAEAEGAEKKDAKAAESKDEKK